MKNKFVLVTGASTGIGRAIAVEYGREGATVGLVARRIGELKKTKEMVEEAGGMAEVFVADLSDLDSVNKLITDIKAKTDEIKILINVAGVWHGEDEVYADNKLGNLDIDVIVDTFNVGIIAPIILTRGLIETMQSGGSIINLSGTFIYGGRNQIPYYVSKRALEDFTIALSEELIDKIYVNCVSPSDTTTESLLKYFPEDSEGGNTPEQVAKLVVEVTGKHETGQFWKIKHGVATLDGYHK